MVFPGEVRGEVYAKISSRWDVLKNLVMEGIAIVIVVAIDVLSAYPGQFQDFIPRLGGMHMLTSFIGAMGTLMSNSGLEELMHSAFKCVQKCYLERSFHTTSEPFGLLWKSSYEMLHLT